jgi:hypothetical protein
MADIPFNISLGKVAYYASLPATNDALILVPLETSGLVSDATMRDYDTLAAILAGATNEQTTMGRKTITSVTVTVDDTNDRVESDFADQTYTAASGNAISAFLVCYDPDTTTGTDSTVIPLSKHDFVATPNGVDDIIVQVATLGFYRDQ